MSSLLILLLCLAAGMALRMNGRLPDNAPAAFNAYVINVALPALAIVHLHRADLTLDLLASAAGAWLMLGTAALFFAFFARRARLDPATTGALILTGGLANTSFVGLPMIEAWIGGDGLPYGLVIDQLLDDALVRLGGTVAPIALLSVGCQLRLGALRTHANALALGLGYKLVLGPLVIALALLLLFQLDAPTSNLARAVILFEAAMGPMIGAAVVANHFKLNSEVTSLMVGLGVPLSLVAAPLWLVAAQAIA
jgi:predicted permease